MKNLTIKKVALGVFLASYAASNAFAALSPAISQNVIIGNKPVFTNIGENNGPIVQDSITVRVYSDADGTTLIPANQKVKVGDYVFVKFKLKDLDDDQLDAAADVLKNTVRVIYTKEKDPFNQSSPQAWKVKETSQTNPTDDVLDDYKASFERDSTKPDYLKGWFRFKLDSKFTGAQKIGFTVLERTQYGLPYTNKYLMVTDITSTTEPKRKDTLAPDQDPAKPTTALPNPESDIGHKEHGPGEPANGVFPVEGDDTVIGIFKYSTGNTLGTKNYTKEETPAYGDRLAAVVWVDDGAGVQGKENNGDIDTGELIMTSSYEFKWFLHDTYTSPDDSTDKVDADPIVHATLNDPNSEITTPHINVNLESIVGTNDTITLGDTLGSNHNRKYDNVKGANSTPLLAGIQGYKLKVYAK